MSTGKTLSGYHTETPPTVKSRQRQPEQLSALKQKVSHDNDCYFYVIQCQMRLRVAVRRWSPLTWSRRPLVGTRAPQKASSSSSSQIRSGAVWPTANPWQSRDPQPLVTLPELLQRRPKAEVNLGPPRPELRLPYHPGQCNIFFHSLIDNALTISLKF